MKREEKNQLTKRKIVDSALREFSKNGYRGCSVNDICRNGGVSKGIVYHYFDTKESLYLYCVEECFALLTKHIGEDFIFWDGSIEEGFEEYFNRRDSFFFQNPIYKNIFVESLIFPPSNLVEGIKGKTAVFKENNKRILKSILERVSLDKDYSVEEVIEVFRDFQGYINTCTAKGEEDSFTQHEKRVKRAISIMLYGVVER